MVPGIIGIQNVIATPAAANIIEPQIVADPVDIVTLLREIQDVKVPDIGDRRNIERAIFHCLGLDTGITISNKQFNFEQDGEYVLEAEDDNYEQDGMLI